MWFRVQGIQGYLAHKKPPPLGSSGGGGGLMSEVLLYKLRAPAPGHWVA